MLELTIAGATEHLPDDARESAMKRYWDAKQTGDTTANIVHLDRVAETARTVTAPGQVSDVAVERVARQDTWLTKAGFAVPPPVFAPGTRVRPLGDDNFRIERRRVEELPHFPDAANRVVETIREEDRRDVRVKLVPKS